MKMFARGGPLARLTAIVTLSLGYGAALAVAAVIPRARRGGPLGAQRILAIGTFHNPNWFFAHLEPLGRCGVEEVVLVGDGYTSDLPGIRVLSPPRWATRLLTRAGAKFVFALWYGWRLRPTLYVGYAIFPAATTALVLGRLLRGATCFQLTSGPLELAGGGFHAENRLLSALGRPSAWVERLAHALTRRFDLMVVRGSQAHSYVRQLGYRGQMEIITGSIEIPELDERSPRDIDLIFVSRLTERKRPARFLDVVALVAVRVPGVRAVMVGDGPEREHLQARAAALGVEEAVTLLGLREDVGALLLRSKVFVLTSRWEGVSIAMLEAMAAGSIPVANDVGDLADFVSQGENGYLVKDDDVASAAEHAVALLRDSAARDRLSRAARATVVDRCSREAIAAQWRDGLTRLFERTHTASAGTDKSGRDALEEQ